MKYRLAILTATMLSLIVTPSIAADTLTVSVWGGRWKEMVAETIAKRFTEETGVEVEYVTGGTVDRLNKARLSKDDPESDVIFTTGQIGWLYASGDLLEELDMSKLPNSADL